MQVGTSRLTVLPNQGVALAMSSRAHPSRYGGVLLQIWQGCRVGHDVVVVDSPTCNTSAGAIVAAAVWYC